VAVLEKRWVIDQSNRQAPGGCGIKKQRESGFQNQRIGRCLTSDRQQGAAGLSHDFILRISVEVHGSDNQCERHGGTSGNTGPTVDEQGFVRDTVGELENGLQMLRAGCVDQFIPFGSDTPKLASALFCDLLNSYSENASGLAPRFFTFFEATRLL
jgi:hypothetical protein